MWAPVSLWSLIAHTTHKAAQGIANAARGLALGRENRPHTNDGAEPANRHTETKPRQECAAGGEYRHHVAPPGYLGRGPHAASLGRSQRGGTSLGTAKGPCSTHPTYLAALSQVPF